MKTENKEQKTAKVVVSPTILGRFKKNYARLEAMLTEQKQKPETIEANIKQRQTEDAMLLGITLDEFQKQLDSIKGSSNSSDITRNKEVFRNEFNRLTDNLLACINSTTDTKVATALKALLEYDTTYQQVTKVEQTTRNDWRGLIIVSPFINDKTKLARYIGGWGDGSKQDRNQYSSGRRVPVAKSTGYAREQVLPELNTKK